MRKIKPEKSDNKMGLEAVKSEKKLIYPTIRIGLEHLPEAKKWKVGEDYEMELELKMVGLSQSRFQNEAEFEIHGIEPDSDGGKSEEDDEEDDEIKMDKEDFIDEHEKLIKILRSGSKDERDDEADEQEKELKKYK